MKNRAKRERPREKIFARAYWFDRGRSLSQLHGWAQAEPGDGLGLIGRYTAAVNKPVGTLESREIHMLLTQGTDPHYIVPVALERLRARVDPELLRCLLRINREFWRTHPFLHGELCALADEVVGSTLDGDDLLRGELAAFVAPSHDRRGR